MKIALIGYGKMGHMIEQIALARGHEIVCKIDKDNQSDFDSPAFASADVAIEFTNPTAAYGNYLKAFSHNVKVVSGSTGWMKDHKADVEALTKDGKQTLFWASNFSIGVAIFSAVNKYLAKIMNQFPQYDVQLTETHHVHKLDAPSGTAITLAEEIVDELDRKHSWKAGKGVGTMVMWTVPTTISPMSRWSIASATTRCLASTASVTTQRPTVSPSPTMPIRARVLPWAPCLLRNSRLPTKACSPQATSLSSKHFYLINNLDKTFVILHT